jgi:hypothetical protein
MARKVQRLLQFSTGAQGYFIIETTLIFALCNFFKNKANM